MWTQEEFEERLDQVPEEDFDGALLMMLEEGVKVNIPEYAQDIMKSFQKINRSIVFLDSETSTVDVNKRIFALCTSFKMPISFALQNLNKLLLALKSVKTNEIVIHGEYIQIEREDDKGTRREMTVHHHDNFDLIESPAKAYEKHNMDNIYEMMDLDPNFADADLSFDLSGSDMRSIKEANKIMDGRENQITFTFKEGFMSISISDEADDVADTWKVETPIPYDGDEFELIYHTADLDKLIYGEYTVYVYEDGIAGFRLKPIEVDGEMIDLGLTYIVTIGSDN